MEIEGEQRIQAPRLAVWRALNDPAVLAACIPGCERFEATAEGAFAATLALRIGSLAARFSGTVSLSEVAEAEAYTLNGQGQGGVAGFARGSARVELSDDGAATLLRWSAKAEIGGRLASVGGRLIHGYATKTAGEFFGRLGLRLAGPS
jgi:uncharacterized protein